MSALLETYSKFYYGIIVDDSNFYLDFDEGAGELTAELNAGAYSLTDFLTEIKRALDDAGTLTYTVTVDRSTRLITITSTASFDLLVATGSHFGTDGYSLIGFTGVDKTGLSTYTGTLACGSEFKPQFKLQSYISSEDWQQAADAAVNKTASGEVEVVNFGIEKFIQFQIKFQTGIDQGNCGPIKTDANGLDNLRDFLQYVMRRSPFEFIPDESAPNTYQKITLDSSPDSQTGTGYKIKEMYDKNLPGYYETSVLKFRLNE